MQQLLNDLRSTMSDHQAVLRDLTAMHASTSEYRPADGGLDTTVDIDAVERDIAVLEKSLRQWLDRRPTFGPVGN